MTAERHGCFGAGTGSWTRIEIPRFRVGEEVVFGKTASSSTCALILDGLAAIGDSGGGHVAQRTDGNRIFVHRRAEAAQAPLVQYRLRSLFILTMLVAIA